MKKTKKNKGFTLIEILVVIGLIAILAAVVLIAINPARQFRQANNSQRSANVNAILNAVGQYAADHKGNISALGIVSGNDLSDAELITGDNTDMCEELVPQYLPMFPADPDNGEPVKEEGCDTAGEDYDVGYSVVDIDGRITVIAPKTEDPDDGSTVALAEQIQVTR